jgi:hypothetical protein
MPSVFGLSSGTVTTRSEVAMSRARSPVLIAAAVAAVVATAMAILRSAERPLIGSGSAVGFGGVTFTASNRSQPNVVSKKHRRTSG